MTADTQELLAAFVRDRSEAAFRELVMRYVDLVYSTALRLVEGDAHRARDVSQIVFADLAKMAAKLAEGTRLGGWLHRHTCFVARTIMRGERRRLARERQAVEMNALNDDHGLAQIAPILDEAIQELGPDDRDAILLRFFERRSLRSVGEALGINENVAQKRVAQAVHELGKLLRRRGVALSAAALAGALAAGAVTAAPSGLALSIAASAWSGVAGGGSSALTAAKVAGAAKIKAAIMAGVVTLVVATAIMVREQSKANAPNEAASEQQQPVVSGAEVVSPPPPVSEAPPSVLPAAPPRPTPAPPPHPAKATSGTLAPQTTHVAMAASNSMSLLSSSARQIFGAHSGSKVRIEGTFEIEGTSNIGDWQAEAPFIGGTLEIDPVFTTVPAHPTKPLHIPATADIFIPVKSLKSVKKNGAPYSDKFDTIMNHEMLKADHHPKILFHLSELWLTRMTNYHNIPRYEFASTGELAVAGVTNEILMPVFIESLNNGRFKLSGEISLKMSSFGIEPSTSIAGGLIKPGDDIRVLVEWVFGPKPRGSTAKR
jgi:RNA polymerase sigma factor (sigma-70 family)